MSNFFERMGTQICMAFGTLQRTEYDIKIRDGIQHYTQSKNLVLQLLDDIKSIMPNVNMMTRIEKLAHTLSQISQMYWTDPTGKSFKALAIACEQIGKLERLMEKAIKDNCMVPMQNFCNQTFVSFRKETLKLDDKCLDMDGAKNKQQKKPSPENQRKETEATGEFNAQRAVVESMVDDLPKQYELQRASMKAFTQALIDMHTKQAELLTNALNTM